MTAKKQQTNIRPLGGRVLIREDVRKDTETKTQSGIIIPATAAVDTSVKRGIVVEVGEGRYESGKLIPVSVKKGDAVLFTWGEGIVVDDTKYVIVQDTEIIAVVE